MVSCLVLLCSLPPPAGADDQPQSALAGLMDEIEQKYPNTPHIRLDQAKARLSTAIFVDVRQPQEYAVSRIPGAINVHDPDELLAFASATNEPIVLYCSVGYRSAERAKQLRDAGLTNVTNFTGSIFAWANENLRLEDDLGPTDDVHPYNWYWGWRYLDDRAQQPSPASP